MKTGLYCVLFFIAGLSVTRPQQLVDDERVLDSLTGVLEISVDDTARAVVLQKLSDYWLYKDSARSMAEARRIITLALKNNSGVIAGIGHYQVGGVFLEHQGIDSAEYHYRKAFSLLENDSSLLARQYLARTWHDYGITFQYKNQDEKFMDILLNKANPILKETGDTLRLAMNYHDVGLVLMNSTDWPGAQVYFNKAIEVLQDYPNYELLAETYLQSAYNLMSAEDDSPGKIVEMQGYLDKGRELLVANPRSKAWVLYYTFNGIFQQYYRDNPSGALKNFDDGLALARELGETYRESELVNRKFYLYFDEEQYDEAAKMAQEQHEMASRFGTGRNIRIALRHMIDVEEKSGNIDKAYTLLKQHVALSDSLKENETQIRIKELEQQYEGERQKNEILELKNENSEKELQLEHFRFWNYIVWGIALLLAVGIFATLMIYRNKRQISRQKEELHKKELQRLEQERRLSNFSAMIEGQEQERKRIAQDLHDGLGGALSGIKIKLSGVVGAEKQNAGESIAPVLIQLDHTIDELRSIARNLMPESLLRYDLSTALSEFCNQMQNEKTKIFFQAYGMDSAEIPQTTKMMLYRVLQELVTNAVKHAEASQVLVQLMRRDTSISLNVEDDGKGFEPEGGYKPGLGLATVKARVEYLRGDMEIRSVPGTGTTVDIHMDLEQVPGE